MCARVSDSPPPRWLADDAKFLASLGDLDRGIVGDAEDEAESVQPPARPMPPSVPQTPAPAPRPLAAARPPAARAIRPINAARALDPSRLLETTPPGPLTSPPPPALPGSFAPPVAFGRQPAAEPRPHRPLLDLFPASALVPETAASRDAFLVPPTPAPPPARHAPMRLPERPSPMAVLTYETFYGLREKPFSLSTDPRFQYQSAAHERAGQHLFAAIRQRTGTVVLTGAGGMGKTTLCRAIAAALDRRTVTSLVLEPPQSFDDLLKTMLADFGVVSRDDLVGAAHLTREALRRTLGSFLDSLVRLQADAVVLIDEAQNVPVAVLAELAAMVGAGGQAPPLQMVLVGQPALTTMLKHAELRALDAGVAQRTVLGPLEAGEISSYVMHRLSVAGAHTRIEFDADAIVRLFELSAGSPRVVNLVCDRAMTRGQAASAGVIDVGLIDAAAGDLDLEAPRDGRRAVLSAALPAVALVLLFLAGAAAALYVSRAAVGRILLQWQNVPAAPGGPIRRVPPTVAPVPPPDATR